MTCPDQRLVDAHFRKAITPAEERSMREHLETCSPCRARYRRQLLLAKLDPAAASAEERVGRGLGLERRARTMILPFTVTAVAMAAAVLLFLRSPADPVDAGFSARGPASNIATTAPEASPRITVYRVPKLQGITVATDSLQRGDELAFAYQNGSGKTHLMIFAVDEHGLVYWFFPAWTTDRENPSAIAIDPAERTPHELREAIRHRFEGERLEIHGLFLDRPLTVREAEAAVRSRGTDAGPVSVPGGIDHVMTFEMSP